MSYQSPKEVASSPGLYNVTGKFCFPNIVSHEGRLSFDLNLIRPLSIAFGEVLISTNADGYIITMNAVNGSEWGVNPGDFVVFVGTECDGIYELSLVDLSISGESRVYGPTETISKGFIYFLNKNQKVIGTNTKFKKNLSVGDYIVINDNSSTYASVQALKITKIESDEVLYVEKGMVDAAANDYPFLSCTKGSNRGVSIKCMGAGYVNGQEVAQDDILTFYDELGLEPVYGDSGASIFKILIQK